MRFSAFEDRARRLGLTSHPFQAVDGSTCIRLTCGGENVAEGSVAEMAEWLALRRERKRPSRHEVAAEESAGVDVAHAVEA